MQTDRRADRVAAHGLVHGEISLGGRASCRLVIGVPLPYGRSALCGVDRHW
jgi:hypothetical protein